MKGLGLFAIAALFSATAFAQVDTEERDMQNRRAPVKTETETKTKSKSDVSKADEDYKDKSSVKKDESGVKTNTKTKTVTKSETSDAAGVTEDNTICCGKEKDDGFLGIWKFDIQNSEKENKQPKQYGKVESKTETETELGRSDLRESEMDVSTESDLRDEDTRMDAAGRTESLDIDADMDLDRKDADLDVDTDLDVNKESDLNLNESESDRHDAMKSENMKDSGSRCPAVIEDESDSELEDSDQRMENDNSPKF